MLRQAHTHILNSPTYSKCHQHTLSHISDLCIGILTWFFSAMCSRSSPLCLFKSFDIKNTLWSIFDIFQKYALYRSMLAMLSIWLACCAMRCYHLHGRVFMFVVKTWGFLGINTNKTCTFMHNHVPLHIVWYGIFSHSYIHTYVYIFVASWLTNFCVHRKQNWILNTTESDATQR